MHVNVYELVAASCAGAEEARDEARKGRGSCLADREHGGGECVALGLAEGGVVHGDVGTGLGDELHIARREVGDAVVHLGRDHTRAARKRLLLGDTTELG